jgi:hypothetical protein
MSKIEKELLDVLEMRGPKASEGPQDYFKRLAVAAGKLDNDDWDKLSQKAQDWVNDASEAINKKKKIVRFPDMKDDEYEEAFGSDDKDDKNGGDERGSRSRSRDTGDGEDEGGDDKKGSRRSAKEDEDDNVDKKKAKAGKPGGKAKSDDKKGAKAAKDKPKSKSAGPKKERGTGAQVEIKRAVIKDPSKSTDEIVSALNKKGIKVTASGASTIRSGTIQTLRLIKELGMPKNLD